MKALGAGKIKIGFINGDHFHDRRELNKDGGNAIAPFGIPFVMAIKEDGMRAQARRGAQGHRRMDAEFARFVAGSGDNTALIGPAANDNGLAAEVGALEEFHGNEEGVHIHMEDGGVEREFTLFNGIVFGAKAGQVRHAASVRLWLTAGNVHVTNWRVCSNCQIWFTVG